MNERIEDDKPKAIAKCPTCGAPFVKLYKDAAPLFQCGSMIQMWKHPDEYLQGSKQCTINAQANRIAELEAIMDKLPKTADGVPLVDGLIIYGPGGEQGYLARPPYRTVGISRRPFYSTREAAEAAKESEVSDG